MFSGLNASSAEASTSATASFTSPSSNKNGFKANSSTDPKASNASSSSYKENLKALNESVAAWIQKHIAVNPYVDLSPIFNDYKEHMKNIDLKFSSSTKETEDSASASDVLNATKKPAVTSASIFSAPSQVSQATEESRSDKLNTGESLPSCQEKAHGIKRLLILIMSVVDNDQLLPIKIISGSSKSDFWSVKIESLLVFFHSILQLNLWLTQFHFQKNIVQRRK